MVGPKGGGDITSTVEAVTWRSMRRLGAVRQWLVLGGIGSVGKPSGDGVLGLEWNPRGLTIEVGLAECVIRFREIEVVGSIRDWTG